MKKSVLFFSALIMLVCFTLSYADDKAKAVSLVDEGIAYINKNGKDKAFKEFTRKNGMFTKGELYIFAVDFKGMTLGHGGNDKLVGKSMYDLKDSDGNYFIRKFIDVAKEKGQGWVDYKWSNPKTKMIEQKSTYVKRIPGSDYFLGCGIYLKK
jgi:cytochrome c